MEQRAESGERRAWRDRGEGRGKRGEGRGKR